MADITTRAGKGSPLTNNEVDANFTNLNTDKAENGANTDITSLAGITGGVSTADYVDFDTLASGVARATGRLTWNDTDGCLEVGLKGSDVTQQIGQEMVTRVYNADSTTISNGEVVYFWSTAGEVIAGKKYIANATIDPHLIVGLATEDIAAGSYGYVTEFGFVRGLDTAAFNPGDILFCSPTVAGAIQSNEPSTPNDVVRIGICLESDSTNGIVLVNPHDVPRADEIRYDNADSGLASTNVKSAIDELELVKADIALLTSNVTFYLTSANDGVLAGYKQLVTSTLDTNYDEIAFDYLTSTISNTATMLQAWVSDVNVLVGDIAGIVVPIVGNVRKDTGAGDARFYFEVYIRESDGTETLVTTSNVSDYITSTIYGQISLSATVSLQTFTDTDRVVIKLYGQTDSSTAAYELQLGGSSPFRSLFPVPVSVVPSVANAYAIVADTTNFNGKLSSTDNNVQEALETLDDHVHQASEITGLTASNTTTNTSVFNGHLSATDTDIQKALNTLDDVDLQGITDVGATTTTAVTINAALDVDDLKLDGDTISNDGAAVDGNIVLSPKGAGEVDISKVDIDGGAIDDTTIGGTTPGAGTFTDLTVNTTATFAGATIADLGTVTTADINGGTIDGVALDATIADIDNIRIDGNSIISTDGNGNIDLTPNGLGEVNISKVDIAAGEIDGTTIGATVAAAGNFTALDVSASASFAGATIDDLGTVTTADINGGTIDGADITVGTGKTLSVINGTLTLADNQISGDKVHGGIISNFASTGIDDNATSTAITIDSSENVSLSNDLKVDTDTLVVDSTNNRVGINKALPDYPLSVSGDIQIEKSSAGILKLKRDDTVTSTGNGIGQIQAVTNEGGTDAVVALMRFEVGDTPGTDAEITLETGGTERLRIDSVGRVGVGTNNPSTVLHTVGSATNITRVQSTGASPCYTHFLNPNGSWYSGTTGSGDYQVYDLNASASRLRINSSGDVGIGTSPDSDVRLTVADAGTAFLRVRSTDAAGDAILQLGNATDTNQSRIHFRGSDESLRFFTQDNSRMAIGPNGEVGINISTDFESGTIFAAATTSSTVYSPTLGASNYQFRFRNYSNTDGSTALINYTVANTNGSSSWWNVGAVSLAQNYDSDFVFQARIGSSAYAERLKIETTGKTTIQSSTNETLVLKREGSGSNPYLSFVDGSDTLQSYIQSQGVDGDFAFINSMDDGRFQFSITGGVGDGSNLNRFDFQGASAPEGDYPTTIRLYDQAQGSGWAAGDLFAAIEMDSVDGSGSYTDVRGRIAMAMETSTGGGHSMRLQVADFADGTLKNFMSANHAGEVSFYSSGDEVLKIEDGGEIKIKNVEPTFTLYDSNNGNAGGSKAHIRFESNDGNATTYIGVPQSTVNHLYISTTAGGGAGYVTGSSASSHVITEARDDIIWRSGNQTSTNNMILKATGRLGLGEANPDTRLHVDQSFAAGTTTARPAILTKGSFGGAIGLFDNAAECGMYAENAGAKLRFYTNRYIGTDTAGSKTWMTLDGSGNLLLGTGSPIYNSRGPIQSITANSVAINYAKTSNSTGQAGWGVIASNGDVSTYAMYYNSAMSDNATYCSFFNGPNNSTNYVYVRGNILRMSVTASHIGTSSGTIIGTQTSDERIKTIESEFEYGLDSVMSLTPIAYSFKDEQERRLGFGAQTTQAIIPEAVYDTGECIDGYDADEDDPMAQTAKSSDTKLAMEYVQLIPVLTKAIQEQQAMIETLQAEVAALKGAN